MEELQKHPSPFSQHYRCALELFDDVRAGVVFGFLFDEFLCQMRQGKGSTVKFSKLQIEIKTCVNRHGLSDTLAKLEGLGVIRLAGNQCEIMANYFMAVINLFSYAKGDQRKIIKSAFLTHNLDVLNACGLTMADVANEITQLAKGSIKLAENASQNLPGYKCQADNATINTPKLAENANFDGLLAEFTNFINNRTWELEDELAESANFVSQSPADLSQKDKLAFLASLVRCGASVVMDQIGRKCHNDWQNMPIEVAEYANRNIKEKINKKENKLSERSELSYIGGEKEKIEKPSGDLEIIELVDNFSEKEIYQKYKSTRIYSNPYKNKPYFSEKDMERITGDIEACTKSPVKLFIYNLWGGLYDWYQAEIEDKLPADEYGEPLSDNEPSDLDIIRTIISEVMFARIVKQAWYETEGQIECKCVQLENGSVPVEIDELPAICLEHLIDWRTALNENNEKSFVISLEGFRNIEADDVVEVKQAKNKNEKKAMNRMNRQMIATIMSTDNSQLTPIETAIKDFTSKFIQLDDSLHFEGFLNGNGKKMGCNELPGYLIKPWSIGLAKLGIKAQDFYDTFNLPGEYKDGSNLRPMATTFSHQKVQRWNEMNGYQSQITPEMLEKAVLEGD